MPEPRWGACVKCGRDGPLWALRACPICGKTICTKCATFDFGRYFCSQGCGHYFFHGDGEEVDSEES